MRFNGEIAGMGTASGVRIVVGMWTDTPLGEFADVMLQQPDGHRVLMAPSPETADFIAATYSFDEVRLGPVMLVRDGDVRSVETDDLTLEFSLGPRSAIGRLLRLVPERIATAPRWLVLIDPIARIAMKGVRTRGSAGGGRREFYGATDNHAVTHVGGQWEGTDLGDLRPVVPAVTFGFGSTPAAPSVTRIVTTILGA